MARRTTNRVLVILVIKRTVVEEEQISVGVAIGERTSTSIYGKIMHRSWACIIFIVHFRIREQVGLIRVKDILNDIIIVGNPDNGLIVGAGDIESRGATVGFQLLRNPKRV